MEIGVYSKKYEQAVIDLILDIQQNEFGVPVTIADQPDLLNVENVYCRNNGNFWIATDQAQLIGTIALIDIGKRQSSTICSTSSTGAFTNTPTLFTLFLQ